MAPRRKFVAGNWKMYTTLSGAKTLAQQIVAGLGNAAAEVAVCPPYPWLLAVGEVLKGSPVALGAQDVAIEAEGAFTGQVSVPMIREAGASCVIIAHSERRHGLNETDAVLNRKAKSALAAGLRVIFCIGELLAEREANQTEAVLARQLTAGLAQVPVEHLPQLVLAYEPVWAIGTGKTATPEQAQAAHAFIRQTFATLFGSAAAQAVIIQYGGSVKPDNAQVLLHQPDVDGALVGGASLKADSFLAIVQAAG
jgi:triosephosphate isomerase